MKKVFRSQAQCAHVWAAQTQTEGRSGPLWFDGPTIYSYGTHYPIASFQRGVVLYNSTGSSATTEGKHKNAVRSALHGLGVPVIRVPHRFVTGRESAECLQALLAERMGTLAKAARARLYAEGLLERADTQQNAAVNYALAFDLPVPVFEPFDRAAILAKLRTARAAVAARETAAEAEWRAEYAVNLAKWRDAGETISGFYAKYPVPTALRLSNDGTAVQTSRGASVPVSDARKLWGMIKLCRATGEHVLAQCGDHRIPVGAFELREIRADGTAVIGCHTLEYSETSAFAAAQGWGP